MRNVTGFLVATGLAVSVLSFGAFAEAGASDARIPRLVVRQARITEVADELARASQTRICVEEKRWVNQEGDPADDSGVRAAGPTVIRLFEVGDLDVEKARLIYRARLRTKNVDGQVYLEMWCHFPGKGEFFSRGLQTPLTGTTDWTTEETPFFLKQGENPDNVKLNLVINGTGTAWVDDIRLLRAPLT